MTQDAGVTPRRPLDGIRVLELGQLIAGPFAGCILGYFGAEVIKVESPDKGDPLREWRVVRDGTSLWWHSLARNKKCITVALGNHAGQALVRRLASQCDVVLENFRPGTMERWGLGPAVLRADNPGLIYARISGYGQDGPDAAKPGFASVCEAFGGLRYLTGFPGQRPVRPNLSLGDSLAGIHAALGIVLALLERERGADGRGQIVDAAIYEAVFNLLEGVIPEYDGAGIVRQPSGSTVTGIVPTNTYLCADGKYVVIGGNTDSIFVRLMSAIGRPDLADDPRLARNPGRVEHEAEIDAAIAAWAQAQTVTEVLAALDRAEVPAGPIYSVADMFDDAHFKARGLFESVEINGRPLRVPAIAPRLERTPGSTHWPGPALGSANAEILGELLGFSAAELDALRREGAI